MATNVTEKDKTLNEIIDWLRGQRDEEYRFFNVATRTGGVAESEIDGCMIRAQVFARCIDHCKSLLGYSGSMPNEVPNQSEDAK